jgi:hypothetical protein
VQELVVQKGGRLAFAAGTHQLGTLRTHEDVTTGFVDDAVVVVAERFVLGRHNVWNVPAEAGMEAPQVRIFVHGGDDDGDGDVLERPRAAVIGAGSRFVGNVVAFSCDDDGVVCSGGTVHLVHDTVAVGAFFGQHVIVGHHVDLTLQSALFSDNGTTDLDADHDGVVDDNCPTIWNPAQADGDDDGVGDACDNCPTTWNPDQRDDDVMVEGSDGRGNACTPGAPFCGDGVVSDQESCDDGADTGGPGAPCDAFCRDVDGDDDGIGDDIDVCPEVFDPAQQDSDMSSSAAARPGRSSRS